MPDIHDAAAAHHEIVVAGTASELCRHDDRNALRESSRAAPSHGAPGEARPGA